MGFWEFDIPVLFGCEETTSQIGGPPIAGQLPLMVGNLQKVDSDYSYPGACVITHLLPTSTDVTIWDGPSPILWVKKWMWERVRQLGGVSVNALMTVMLGCYRILGPHVVQQEFIFQYTCSHVGS